MTTLALRSTRRLDEPERRELRARAIFELGKLDPQCGDVDVLAPYALMLEEGEWDVLRSLAESLGAELLDAERELLGRPELWPVLGIRRRLGRCLERSSGVASPSPRVIRFDFHPTRDGWRISEANADVPGGFLEASGLSAIMAGVLGLGTEPECPTRAVVDAFARRTRAGALVGLVHSTAYTDDRQVMSWLARHFEVRGLRTELLAPDQVVWSGGTGRARTCWSNERLDAIFRFVPADWLVALGEEHRVGYFESDVLQMNPPSAILAQSKRLPLVWARLSTPMPTWRRLLPETRSVSRWTPPTPEWVHKPAFGRVGEGVTMTGVTSDRAAMLGRASMALTPRAWISQRRFESEPVETPDGPRHACIGVYVIDGQAGGVYGRVARRPLIDGAAQDAALLIASNTRSSTENERESRRSPSLV